MLPRSRPSQNPLRMTYEVRTPSHQRAARAFAENRRFFRPFRVTRVTFGEAAFRPQGSGTFGNFRALLFSFRRRRLNGTAGRARTMASANIRTFRRSAGRHGTIVP